MILRGPANTSTLSSLSFTPSPSLSFTASLSLSFIHSNCLLSISVRQIPSVSLSLCAFPSIPLSLSDSFIWLFFCHFQFHFLFPLITFCLHQTPFLSLMLNFVAYTLFVSNTLIHTCTSANCQTLPGLCVKTELLQTVSSS